MALVWTSRLACVEVAAASVTIGIVEKGPWLVAGAAVAVVLVAAVLPAGGKPLVVALLRRLRVRRRARTQSSFEALLGDYRVVSIAAGRHAPAFAAVREGTTFTAALQLDFDNLFNEDPPIPVARLASTLVVDDVPLSSLRLVTVRQSSPRHDGRPVSAAPLAPLVQCFCFLTVDVRLARAAILGRGDADLATVQVLRRCVKRIEEVFAPTGASVRVLDADALTAAFTTCLGQGDGVAASTPAAESWDAIAVGHVRLATRAMAGRADAALAAASALSASSGPEGTVTCLVLRPASNAVGFTATLLIRTAGEAADRIAAGARQFGVTLRELPGEQLDLLRASLPVGTAA